jgi:hypothetical protein
MPTETTPKRRSNAKLGCLTFVAGAILGFIVALMWSNSQVHTLGSQELRGENRSRIVLAHACLGGILGGFLVSGIVVIRRKFKERHKPSDPQELP